MNPRDALGDNSGGQGSAVSVPHQVHGGVEMNNEYPAVKRAFKVRNMKDVDRYPSDDKRSKPFLNRLTRHVLKQQLKTDLRA